MRRNFFFCLLLAGITLGLYWPVRSFDLIYFDDPQVLTGCPEVQAGLTWASVKWALTSVVIANWHPVTNLSFLAVSQFFGTAPGPHHLANAVIHAANSALLFLLLRRLTGATWRSAIAAAIFAWHPLRVESVAWIVERKDVLCAFFFLLSLLAYAKSAEGGVRNAEWKKYFGASLLAFALALLSKPMAVTLPFVLLLLDVWPLNRVEGSQLRVESRRADSKRQVTGDKTLHSPLSTLKPLLFEKWPFFALMILFCVVTYWVQHDHAAMMPWEKLGLTPRVANAIAGYVAYLAQLFWPVNLAAMYPFPKSFDPAQTVLKAALLIAISFGCLTQLARRPWLAVGWCWYLGTALPIIGLVQVGSQSMADRYTYLPLIGPVVALVWTAAELFSRARGGKFFLTTAAILILSALAILSARQLQFWRNTVKLFEHTVTVTQENAAAYYILGLGLEYTGDTRHAIVCYRVAKAVNPLTFARQNLADLLYQQGLLAAAESECQGVLAMQPDDVHAHISLGEIFAAQGRRAESFFQLNEAVRLNPDSAEALNNLAWALATSPRVEVRDGPRAVTLAQHACELTRFQKTIYLGTLAAAQAEAGKFDEAIVTAQRACDRAAKNGEQDLLQRNQKLLERYRQHQSARE